MTGYNIGQPLPDLTPEQIAAFWAFVRKDPDGCWAWTGASSAPPQHDARYGTFRVAGKMRKAHRIAYLLTYEEDPGAAEVLHSCDNTLCVRPDHLSLGTHADNMHDMITKGRARGRSAANRGKTHCDKNHSLSGTNLYIKPNGERQCRRCRNDASNRFKERKRQQRAQERREAA
jgi:hypothetical protein